MSPAPEEWYDKGGIVETLVKRFRIPSKKKRNVVRVLRELQKCRSLDISYPRENNKGGRLALIQQGTEDEKIIANWMEMGIGFTNTLGMVNTSRLERSLEHVGRSAIVAAFRCMTPVITKISKQSQGSTSNENGS